MKKHIAVLLKLFAVFGSALMLLHAAAAASHLASFSYDVKGNTVSLEADEVEGGEYKWFVDGVLQPKKERNIDVSTGSENNIVVALKVNKDGETGSTAKLIELGGKSLKADFNISQQGAEEYYRTEGELILDASRSSSGSVEIESYRWLMDGEEIGTGESIKHTVKEVNAGVRKFKLEITDTQGNKDTMSKEVPIIGTDKNASENSPPKAKIDANPVSPSRGDTVVFNGERSLDPDGDIFKYSWYVDGQLKKESTESSVFEFTPSAPKDYNVVLEVQDYGGKTSQAEKTITVSEESKLLDLDWSPRAPEVGKPVRFTVEPNLSEGREVSNYRWYVNDKQIHSGKESKINLVFPEKGLQQVKAEVMYESGDLASESAGVNLSFSWAATEKAIEEVKVAPTVDFEVATESPKVNEQVKFDGTASRDPDGNITQVRWFVNNVPQPASSLSLEKRFDETGKYKVALEIVDDDGFKVRESKSVDVGLSEDSEPPEARISTSPEEKDTSTVVILDGSNSKDLNGNIDTYQWDVDSDGTYDYDSQKIAYVYSSSGSHSVSLRAEDTTGLHSTATTSFYVDEKDSGEGEAPKAGFDASDLGPRRGQEVTFDASISSDPDGDIEKYRWFVNGENVSNEQEISQTFEESGEHQVLLQVVDSNNNTDNKIKIVEVETDEEPEDLGIQAPPIPGGGARSSLRKDVRFGFTKGWNMISAFGMGSILMDSIKRRCKDSLASDRPLYLDGGQNKRSQIIEPSTGYFLEFKEKCTVTISGSELRKTPRDHSLKAGQNTISVPYMTSLQDIEGSCSFQKNSGAYAWHLSQGEWDKYDMDDKLQPDKGYFVITNDQCRLDIQKCGEVRLTKHKGKAAMRFDEGPRCDGSGSKINVTKKNGEFQKVRVTPSQDGSGGVTAERQDGERASLESDDGGKAWLGYLTAAVQVAAGVAMIYGGVSSGGAEGVAQAAMGASMAAGGTASAARTAGQEGD